MAPVNSAALAALVLSNFSTAAMASLTYTALSKEDLVKKFIAIDGDVQVSNIKASTHYDKCTRYYSGGNSMGFAWEKDKINGNLTDSYLIPDKGIILSTGNPLHFESNDSDQQTTQWYNSSGNFFDYDLYKTLNNPASVFDACYLQFDFKCTSDAYVPQISFEYMFGSEEYYEYVNSPFNDAFALILNGNNIAKLPTTETNTDVVSINNVNYHVNKQYFHGNDPGTGMLPDPAGIEVGINYPQIEPDGFTVILTAVGDPYKDPLKSNRVKIVVGDVGDGILDSWVLLSAGSFSCVQLTKAPSQAPTSPPSTAVPTSPPSTAAPTSPPSTAVPTSPPSTKAPTSPPSTKAPTSPPSTAAPTSPPSTAVPTSPPSTAVPTSPPSTAVPTSPPSTKAPTSPPLTKAPTSPPSTAAPTSPPSTAVPTSPPSTAAPTSPPSTKAPTPFPTSLSSIGPSTVFNDLDADGVQDVNENGLAGITIVLYNAVDDTPVATTETDENGVYEFNDLFPGSYYATVFNTTYYFSPVVEGGNQVTANEDGPNGNTPTIEVGQGEIIDNWNVGLFQPVTVGNRVWLDYNANGVQDAGEPGLGNVTVVLVDQSGTPIDGQVKTSDPDGYYLFTGLPPGVYAVEFNIPEDYEFSPSSPQFDAIDRSDPNAGDYATEIDGSGMASPVELEAGAADLTFDAGVYIPVHIGGTIFLDQNANGVRDAGETGGVEGATIMLYNADDVIVDEVVTGPGGTYVFLPMPPGTYYAKLLTPSPDFIVSPIAEGGNTFDSTHDPAMAAPVTVSSGENASSHFNGGLFQGATAVLYIWDDANGNGIQDEGEGPYTSNGTINLYGPNSTAPVFSGPIGPNGTFTYSVPPGLYTVEVVLSNSDSVFSPQDQGSDDTVDSDVDASGTVSVILTSGEDSHISAGVAALPVVGPNCVFLDSNGNGLQDEGELPLSGVKLELYHSNGTLAAVTTSDDKCFYRIVAPYVGDYFLRVVIPQDFDLSPVVDGGNQISSNEDGSNSSPVVKLTLGFVEDSWNVALYMPVSIGNMVWNDLDGDGIQDKGEPGIEGIVVTLNDNDGFQVATTSTDNTGHYLFEGLTPGKYSVAFELPDGYAFTITAKTTADIVDPADGSYAYGDVTSDVDRDTGATPKFTILSGSTNLSIDAGMFLPVTINGTTWHDLNADGFRDKDEPILEGSTVTLFDADGDIAFGTSPQVVAESGVWSFGDLPPGTYFAQIQPPSGEWYLSPIPDKEGNSTSTDFSPDDLKTSPVFLQSGESGDGSFDAGFYMFASVGDRVWFDAQPNGIQDFGEGPMNDTISVKLYDSLGYLKGKTKTSAGGFYQFTGLRPGTYEVEFQLPSEDFNFAIFKAGDNDALDSDANTKTGRAKVTLQSGEINDDIDAGMMDASPYYPDWTNDVQVCTNDGFDPAWLEIQKVNYLYSNKEACCKQHFWWRMTQCMANEEFKFYKNGEICDSKVTFEDWEENTPDMFLGTESTLFDTLDECCANMFFYDLDGCMSRSPVMFKFEFCVDIEGLVEPLDCQNADIYANVLEDAMNAKADIGMGEVDANITKIGDVSLSKVTGSTVCGGPLANQGFTNDLTGTKPDIEAAAGSSLEVCGVLTVEAGNDCKQEECLLSQFEEVKQALFAADITGAINHRASTRLPAVPELQNVKAVNLRLYDILIPPSVSGDFDLRYFHGADLTTCEAKPTLAFKKGDVQFDTLYSCCQQHFNWDVQGCCINGGGCPELPVADALDGYYPTWTAGELCAYKASFSVWEERFDTLEDCCTKKFSYDYDNCVNGITKTKVP